ncbi:MAG: tol-pal system-associated acyl-CoA thioesterase [Gammaproteobacteria bacterium]|nr:tol-pal system-associated acyl-CoA thioesterase [Gammaproteobacteria bacterium]
MSVTELKNAPSTDSSTRAVQALAFHWPVRVYYEDTDAGGVVYYANYLKFFERARSEWLRALGIDLDVVEREQRVLFVVRRVEANYLKPARFNDALIVTVDQVDIQSARLCFQQSLLKTNDEQPLSTATVDVVCVDSHSFKATRVPASLTDLMQVKQ